MTIAMPNQFLSGDLIDRCGQRAAAYDRENKFFVDDFDELKNAGFLKLNIPKDLGGLGKSLAETGQELRCLAYRAPATALAMNMHRG